MHEAFGDEYEAWRKEVVVRSNRLRSVRRHLMQKYLTPHVCCTFLFCHPHYSETPPMQRKREHLEGAGCRTESKKSFI